MKSAPPHAASSRACGRARPRRRCPRTRGPPARTRPHLRPSTRAPSSSCLGPNTQAPPRLAGALAAAPMALPRPSRPPQLTRTAMAPMLQALARDQDTEHPWRPTSESAPPPPAASSLSGQRARRQSTPGIPAVA
ncbi:uncharacterized protein LOC123397737 isoform X2 [Hordeum vulgare subsp. vulgare]|uniref:uncharacterized protein LOC123397737 isoform X2 n=1 Tax=Hordeum vulgare subsp. vulgare TaxID=112509 RepID=UPI00162E3AF3|nr:uncharacterized protein LOC123397737 isoform X2 [Hordeum vulgare subsp. vulgare]